MTMKCGGETATFTAAEWWWCLLCLQLQRHVSSAILECEYSGHEGWKALWQVPVQHQQTGVSHAVDGK